MTDPLSDPKRASASFHNASRVHLTRGKKAGETEERQPKSSNPPSESNSAAESGPRIRGPASLAPDGAEKELRGSCKIKGTRARERGLKLAEEQTKERLNKGPRDSISRGGPRGGPRGPEGARWHRFRNCPLIFPHLGPRKNEERAAAAPRSLCACGRARGLG